VQENTSQGTKTSTSGIKQHDNITIDRPRCTIRPPARYSYEDMVFYALVISSCKDLGKSASHICAIIPKGLVNLKLP
jgi:hypothetical protein